MSADRRIYLIYNPTAGRGRTAAKVEGLREKLGERAYLAPTEGPGHAERLAKEAVQRGWARIGVAGGDGVVHEAANGLLSGGSGGSSLVVFPWGSANDYAYALGRASTFREPAPEGDGPRAVDVGRLTTSSGKARYFVNGAGIGFNCAVTHEARRIRFLRGIPLYTLALVRALASRFDAPKMTLCIDGDSHPMATLSLTVCLGQREGNFRLAPEAQLDDGLFDFLHVGRLSRARILAYVPRMISGRIPTRDPSITSGRCSQIEVVSPVPVAVHLDGELFCLPEGKETGVTMEIVSRALRVELFDEARERA